MANSKKNINEELSELKNIPSGKEFSDLISVYKVVQSKYAMNFKNGYDRKQSDGWNGNGRDSYGIVAYTHLKLSGAIQMLGSYGDTIIQFKLLGGLTDYIFFNTDRDPVIRKLQIETYGKPLDVYGQLLELTGDQNIARRYGNSDPSQFGRFYQHEIRKAGYYLRGMVCDYWNDTSDIVVYPFKFSDLITCAVATNLSRYMSEDEVKRHFKGVMGQEERDKQNNFVDIVPHLQVVGAYDPDGAQYVIVGGKIYAPYNSPVGPNILIIDDENWAKPKDKKLFPDDVRLDEMPSNITRKGNFTFKMNSLIWQANVFGETEDGNRTEDGQPSFKLKGTRDWYEWQYLSFMFQNPDWVKENLVKPNQKQDDDLNMLTEAFRQGMSYDEFVSNNGAIMYVCTHNYFVDGIMKHGFSREFCNVNDFRQNGGSLTYGDGVYGTPDLGNASNNLSRKTAPKSEKPDGFKYGDIILKCSLLGGWRGFLIFDEGWAKRIYKDKWQIFDQIDTIIKDDAARNELKSFVQRFSHLSLYDPSSDSMGRTNHVIFSMFNNPDGFKKWTYFFRKYGVRGAIYHGHGDGLACVCYDYSEVVPIALSYDNGKTWTTNGNSWTLDNGKKYSTNGIDWAGTHDRLIYAGDSENKLGHKYKTVSPFPKKVCVDDTIFGCVSVQKNNGKWNCVRMDTLKELFPIDFDEEPTFSIKGLINFVYKGYKFEGKLYNREVDGPTFYYPNREGNEFNISDIDGVIYYYIEGQGEEQQETSQEEPVDNGEYQEMPDETSKESLQEQFFRFLDKIELL